MIAPTLIIGLGGIGSEIVSMVEQKTYGLGLESPNVKYILIDTDEHALQERKRNGFKGLTIRISNNITVEQCLKMNSYAKEEWYPDNNIFMNKTLTDGAGQVRAISRLALEHAVSQEMLDPLFQTIFELHHMQRNTEARTQRIALVSSLAGGTGSGLLLPFAIYLADYLKKHFPQNGYNMNGFFMMPDVVMHYGNGNNVERMSLYSNAYAAVKELDYFIQANIGTVERKENIRLLEAEGEYFQGTLYNFTFLFGLFNDNCGNAEGLKTLQGYKEMIADCIYLPYCSPINERNTAWEDNKFKHLTIMLSMGQEKKYRHFGSIGVAKLQYPYEKVKKYLTLCWAKDTMENDWFYYDSEYYSYVQEYVDQERQGLVSEPMKSLREYYIEKVQLANKPLSQKILDSLEGSETDAKRTAWAQYTHALEEYLVTELDAIMEKRMAVVFKSLRVLQGNLKEKTIQNIFADSLAHGYLGDCQNIFIKKFDELFKLGGQVMQEKKRLALEVFRPQPLHREVKQKYFLEYWLQNGLRGGILHPNGVRYFFIQTQKYFEARANQLEQELKDARGRIETIQEGYRNNSKKNLIDTIEEVNGMNGSIASQVRNEVLYYCYMQGIEKIEQLNKAYELMFDVYRKGIGQLEEKLQVVLNELTHYEGTRVKMICNEKEYLDSVYQEMKADIPNYYGALDKVSTHMFEMAGQWKEKQKDKTVIWESLIQSWENNFQEVYGEVYDMDIISAAEKQVLWERGQGRADEQVVGLEITRILQYCEDKLSAPFLNVSGVPEKEIIKENYFHTSLLDLKGMKREIVEKELVGKNGVYEDKVIDKYTIVYYQSLFGVHANHLDAFKGADEAVAGNCYKAYDDITKRMHLNESASQILTPHLDRNWHKAYVLPEMNRDIQIKREKEEWMALIYGCLMGRITRTEEKKYRISESVFVHEDCGSLLEVMEIIREFREEKDTINQKRKEDLEELLKEDINPNQSKFIEKYKQTKIVKDIYLAYMSRIRNNQRKEIKVFVDAWADILKEYFAVFEVRTEGKVREYICIQVDGAKEFSEGYLPSTTKEEKLLEELKYELSHREWIGRV